MSRPLSLALLVLALGARAEASIYVGNPNLGFRVDRSQDDYIDGVVWLDEVRVTYCDDTTTDYTIDEEVDPVAGYSLTIAGGDLCSVTWYWGSDMDIDGTGFTVRHTGSSTTVDVDGSISPVALQPYQVVSGTMSSGGPYLLSHID